MGIGEYIGMRFDVPSDRQFVIFTQHELISLLETRFEAGWFQAQVLQFNTKFNIVEFHIGEITEIS